MELIRSNRTEALADALAAQVRRHPLDPSKRDVVVVQSRGMERWLSLALAERLGIWANPWFPFPRKLIESVLDELGIASSDETKSYQPSRLKWTLAELLRSSAPPELADYIRQPVDEDRVLRLATRVARVFDEYTVYRPDLLDRWMAGEEPDYWQAELWRRVIGKIGPHHLAWRIAEGIKTLEAQGADGAVNLERLHLFSLETLPPLFLRFFSALSRTVSTTLYLLEPSEAYLGDVSTKVERASMDASERDGHGFLTDVGRLSRDFQSLVLDLDERVQQHEGAFLPPPRSDLLHRFQRDILEFRSPPAREAREAIDPHDGSIAVHACGGPMREAQVLHDLIRGALEDDSDLRPEDIVVMAPDLETYAPVFRAVFGEQEKNRIPYEIHDRGTRDDVSLSDEFLSTLEVLDARFSVLDVMRLMDAQNVRAELRFSESERARLAELVSAAGVRWGIDAEHRGALGFPAEPVHTWRAGFERLFLGFALVPGTTDVFEGRLPRGALSLNDAELVARLSRLCEVLFEAEARMRRPLDLDAWATELGRLCALLFEEDDDSGASIRVLRGGIESLRTLATDSGYSGLVSLKTVRRELAESFREQTPPVGFLRRGVTLTELVPLRSVPFKIVCLVGMNEETFPRADDRPSFDRTKEQHRPGDRNKRDDDRHSFLQALLCARQRLIISYTAPAASERPGQNASAVVLELRDAVNDYYVGSNELLEPQLHPLHAFDSAYFDGVSLPRSFSNRYAEIARIVEQPPVERPLLDLVAPPQLGSDEEQPPNVSVSDLSRWLWNPSEAFIEDVLGARFGRAAIDEPDAALTEISPLDESRVGREALHAELTGPALQDFLSASPEFPDGNWGASLRRELRRELESLEATAGRARSDEAFHTTRMEADIGGVLLHGRLDGVAEGRRVIVRFTKEGKRAELTTWLEHLLMQCGPSPRPTETVLALRGERGEAKKISFGQVGDAAEQLEKLVSVYRESLERPHPLVGPASRAFASTLAKGDDAAFKKASTALEKELSWSAPLRFALDGRDPFSDEAWRSRFSESAIAVYGPMLEHRSAQ